MKKFHKIYWILHIRNYENLLMISLYRNTEKTFTKLWLVKKAVAKKVGRCVFSKTRQETRTDMTLIFCNRNFCNFILLQVLFFKFITTYSVKTNKFSEVNSQMAKKFLACNMNNHHRFIFWAKFVRSTHTHTPSCYFNINLNIVVQSMPTSSHDTLPSIIQ
jgi:hypothetical protein